MLGHTALFLILIHFFHPTLAVPNPANGVFLRDPGATVDLLLRVNEIAGPTAPTNMTELSTIRSEILSLYESAAADAVVLQDDSKEKDKCETTEGSPDFPDILAALGKLNWREFGECLSPPKCHTIETWGTAAIGVCVDDNAVFPCPLLRDLGRQLAERCQSVFGGRTKAGGIRDLGKGWNLRIYRSR